MRTVKFNNEDSVAKLARRAYGLSGSSRATKELLRQAEVTLLKANPQLADLGALERGVIVFVPEAPGLRPSPDLDSPAAPAAGLLEHVETALADLISSTKDSFQKRVEEAEQSVNVAKDPDLRTFVARNVPDAMERLDTLAENAAKAAAEANMESQRWSSALDQARQDLVALRRKGS